MTTDSESFLRSDPRGLLVQILVCPRGSRERIEGIQDGRLKVRLTAPPVEGAANQALVSFIAKTLDIPKRDVTLIAGSSGRRKTLLIEGVAHETALRLLAPAS